MPYGFLELQYNIDEELKNQAKDSKSTQNSWNKLTGAFGVANTAVKNSIANPTQTMKNLATFMNDANVKALPSVISNTVNTVTTKFSGIALAQLLKDGKITCKEAVDYLFEGFAPALNQEAIALGYAGIVELKNSMINGNLDVGAFFNGFSNIMKGIYNTAVGNNTLKNITKEPNRLYFDMTLSDNSNYTSETPDRRVETGNDLSEFCHNLPETHDVQAELQDGRRYTKEEFRSILTLIRDKMQTVTLYLDNEHFNSLILQNFSPSSEGSQKSGFTYSLQFKKINPGSIEEVVITQFSEAPTAVNETQTSSFSGVSSKGLSTSGLSLPDTSKGIDSRTRQDKPGASQLTHVVRGEANYGSVINLSGNAFKRAELEG